jgi:hypothetical protein
VVNKGGGYRIIKIIIFLWALGALGRESFLVWVFHLFLRFSRPYFSLFYYFSHEKFNDFLHDDYFHSSLDYYTTSYH